MEARKYYEGVAGGWTDGRLGQAYDLIAEVLRERGKSVWQNPLLESIERFDEEIAP